MSEFTIKGIPAAPGVAIGTALVLGTRLTQVEKSTIAEDEVEKEIQLFDNALERTREQILQIQEQVKHDLNDEEAHILDAHLLIIDDHTLINSVKDTVREELVNADYAFQKKVDHYIETISKVADPYIRERGADIKDVASRVLSNMHNKEFETLFHLPGQRIIISPDLTPSDTVSLDRENVQAFATETGSRTSHVAIMARSMKIPAVVALKSIKNIKSGNIVVVDGYKGSLTVNPTPQTLDEYAKKEARGGKLQEDLLCQSSLTPETKDGFRLQLAANIEFSEDIEDAKNYCAAGIGLFRTEYIYINSTNLPSEEEQFNIYKHAANSMQGKHVIIRTMDLGGDKLKNILNYHFENNPFLGYRAIRLSLGFKDIFKTQLRAIFRASAYGDIKIMFPLISCIDEVMEISEILEEVKKELDQEGYSYNEDISIGIMIETPSAALISEKLAPYVDFFSIGTNDLVQYTMAVDRNNERVTYLYQPCHPGILQLIKKVVNTAQNYGIWTGICGEMAGDPQFTSLLAGIGIHELSMSPVSIGTIGRIIRKMKMHEAEDIANQALNCSTGKEALELSVDYLKHIDPDIYNIAVKGE